MVFSSRRATFIFMIRRQSSLPVPLLIDFLTGVFLHHISNKCLILIDRPSLPIFKVSLIPFLVRCSSVSCSLFILVLLQALLFCIFFPIRFQRCGLFAKTAAPLPTGMRIPRHDEESVFSSSTTHRSAQHPSPGVTISLRRTQEQSVGRLAILTDAQHTAEG